MLIEEFTATHDNPSRHAEHGQEWMLCGACGACASIVDTGSGEELEMIDYGDESCQIVHDVESEDDWTDGPVYLNPPFDETVE